MSVIVKGMEMPKDCYNCPLHDGETGRCNILGITVCDYIPKECPLVEGVTEQKKGKWLTDCMGIICSNCYYKLETTGLLSYCPHCGAKMEGML